MLTSAASYLLSSIFPPRYLIGRRFFNGSLKFVSCFPAGESLLRFLRRQVSGFYLYSFYLWRDAIKEHKRNITLSAGGERECQMLCQRHFKIIAQFNYTCVIVRDDCYLSRSIKDHSNAARISDFDLSENQSRLSHNIILVFTPCGLMAFINWIIREIPSAPKGRIFRQVQIVLNKTTDNLNWNWQRWHRRLAARGRAIKIILCYGRLQVSLQCFRPLARLLVSWLTSIINVKELWRINE